MAKIQDYLRQGADLLDIAVNTLDAISKLTKNVTDDRAVAILKAISAVVDTAQNGFAGKVTPAEVKKSFASFTDGLADNDAAAEKALKDKFPDSQD